jgi:flavin reductase (DIM6/NTAB) family NADH-FMN oxidoreductase RutF
MISCTIPRDRPKDTRENILATKEFVVSLIGEPFIEAANSCAVEAPAYVDEWLVSGLTGIPSVRHSSSRFAQAGLLRSQLTVAPEGVKEGAVNMECTASLLRKSLCDCAWSYIVQYYSHQDIFPDGGEKPSTTIIIGRIKQAHIRNAVLLPDGMQADPAKLRILSRLGGNTYARVSQGFDIRRPSWKEVKEKIGDKL